MLESYRCLVQGVPFAQSKSRGDVAAPERWSEAVRTQTKSLRKVTGPCLLRITFRLPANKFPTDHPYGNDLDNLLKRFLDALNETVFSDVLGKDGCVVSLEATKVRVQDAADAGAEFEIVMLSDA